MNVGFEGSSSVTKIKVYVDPNSVRFQPRNDQIFYATPTGRRQGAILTIPEGKSIEEVIFLPMIDGGFTPVDCLKTDVDINEFISAMSWEEFFANHIEKQN